MATQRQAGCRAGSSGWKRASSPPLGIHQPTGSTHARGCKRLAPTSATSARHFSSRARHACVCFSQMGAAQPLAVYSESTNSNRAAGAGNAGMKRYDRGLVAVGVCSRSGGRKQGSEHTMHRNSVVRSTSGGHGGALLARSAASGRNVGPPW